jgi:pantetheine-phosphate adenylyltransferase/dephospho-CoA kinase
MKIAITGGIGSGKSTVAKMLAEELDLPYYSFDKIVQRLYSYDHVREGLVTRFGTSDRKLLSEMAFVNADRFDDRKMRSELEEFFTPFILEALEDSYFCQPNAILEFPLLFEKGQALIERFDVIINVEAPLPVRLKRVMERDDRDEAEVMRIIQSQANNTERRSISNYTLNNDEDGYLWNEGLSTQITEVIDQLKKSLIKGSKIGIVSGSFDPITLGHTWVIKQALNLVDYVIVAVATNPTKKHLFDENTRKELIRGALREELTADQMKRVIIDSIPAEELMVSYADSVGAQFIFRGLRGVTDLEYENQLNLVQKKIAPQIETIFLLTPRELIEISSSMIKNCLALREWERVVEPYVSKSVLEKLRNRS